MALLSSSDVCPTVTRKADTEVSSTNDSNKGTIFRKGSSPNSDGLVLVSLGNASLWFVA